MLKRLYIKNYVLIEELEIFPAKGLNIITGETGAGKSILLGATGLLMGERAESKVLYNTEEKCVVEGEFLISPALESFFSENEIDFQAETIIRREIAPNGKSRSFVNDSPVTLDILAALGTFLLDIHSQHETLLLGNTDFQMDVLDMYGQGLELKKSYVSSYQQWMQAKKALEELKSKVEKDQKEVEFARYQCKELSEAQIKAGEQVALEQERAQLENATEIVERLTAIEQWLEGEELSVLALLKSTHQQLAGIAKFNPLFGELDQKIQSHQLELKEIAKEVSKSRDRTEANPERLEVVSQRLDVLYNLQRKHQVATAEALLEIQHRLEQELQFSSQAGELLAAKTTEVDVLEKKVKAVGAELSALRKASFGPLKQEVLETLNRLGLEDAALELKMEAVEPIKSGMDKISFLFSANKGQTPAELKKTASGGEFSRLMLAFKLALASKTELPTIIFDEIDTGISGQTAIQMGQLLETMGQNMQVLAITHLPQIASKGQSHYFVYKDSTAEKTTSRIKKLGMEERIHEIALMLGGNQYTATVVQNAKELLDANT